MANQSKCIGIVTVWGARGIMLSYSEGKKIGTDKERNTKARRERKLEVQWTVGLAG